MEDVFNMVVEARNDWEIAKADDNSIEMEFMRDRIFVLMKVIKTLGWEKEFKGFDEYEKFMEVA